jgi:hypothetical protein
MRQLARLAHAQPADGVAVEVHLHQALGAFAAQIAVHSALHNAEEALPLRRPTPHATEPRADARESDRATAAPRPW